MELSGNENEKIIKANSMNKVVLPDGLSVPQLGQGTWHMGENPSRRGNEKKALKLGIELGMTLIDTAEMYGEGLSESLIGEAIYGIPRQKLFLVSKVYPHNAGRDKIFDSCKASLKRLKTDYLDLYLLHWRGSVPLRETVSCMEELIAEGLIKRWGVSNFDTDDMEELWQIPGGNKCAVNQVLYHLGSRGIEYALLPWMQEHCVAAMAYCPIAQGGALRRGLFGNGAVLQAAKAHNATPAQILLSFDMHMKDVIVIPKAGTPEHTFENAAAGLIKLTDDEIYRLSESFPKPDRKQPLDIA